MAHEWKHWATASRQDGNGLFECPRRGTNEVDVKHYTIAEVEQHVHTCIKLGCIPLDELNFFRALVDQANRAFDFFQRWERMQEIMAGGGE
jgi:hypothetical protein